MNKTAPAGQPQRAAIALLPLGLALAIMLGVTVYPALVTDASGRPSHALLMLLCWAMSAGFVRGVGFVPRHPLPRWLLSTPAALLAAALAAGSVLSSRGIL